MSQPELKSLAFLILDSALMLACFIGAVSTHSRGIAIVQVLLGGAFGIGAWFNVYMIDKHDNAP